MLCVNVLSLSVHKTDICLQIHIWVFTLYSFKVSNVLCESHLAIRIFFNLKHSMKMLLRNILYESYKAKWWVNCCYKQGLYHSRCGNVKMWTLISWNNILVIGWGFIFLSIRGVLRGLICLMYKLVTLTIYNMIYNRVTWKPKFF